MIQANNDNVPAIVAVITGVVFVAISVTIAMTVSLKPDHANASQDQGSSTFSMLDSLAPDIVPEEQGEKEGGANRQVGGCDPRIFTVNLQPGDQGAQVKALQEFLNASPNTRLVETGLGSPGNETGNFGQLTERAVEQFQNTYLGSVSKVEGVWGLQSRMQARYLCENPQQRVQVESGNEDDTTSDTQTDRADQGEQDDTNKKQNDRSEPDEDDNSSSESSDTPSDTSNEAGRNFENYRELEQHIEEGDADFQNRLESEDKLFGGEAQLRDFSLWGTSRIREGETDDVADITFDVEKSDILIKRVDVSFVHTGESGDDEPWDVIESVQLKSDNETVASVDASEDNWTDDGSDYSSELSGDEKFTIRLDDFDEVVNRGDTADLSVHVTTKDNIDDAGDGVSWGVFVGGEGIRVVDAVGVQKRLGENSQVTEFVIDEGYEGDDPELLIESAYDNPESSAIPVDRTNRSGPFNIFAFDIDTRDTDARINTIQLQMEIKGVKDNSRDLTSYNDVVDEAVIKINDQVFTVDSVRSVAKRSEITGTELTFTINENITIEEYDDQTVRLLIRFKGMQGNYEEGLLLRGVVADGGIVSDNLESENGVAGSWHILRP